MDHFISNPALSDTSWLRKIDTAPTSADVMWIVREYVSTWHPDEFARLPEDCRTGRPSHGDVSYMAYKLKRDAGAEKLALNAKHTFFVAATRRLGDFNSVMSQAAFYSPT